MRDRSMIGSTIIAAALLAAGPLADAGFGESNNTGPGKASKDIARGRVKLEPTEHTTTKPKSESLKRLLRK